MGNVFNVGIATIGLMMYTGRLQPNLPIDTVRLGGIMMAAGMFFLFFSMAFKRPSSNMFDFSSSKPYKPKKIKKLIEGEDIHMDEHGDEIIEEPKPEPKGLKKLFGIKYR